MLLKVDMLTDYNDQIIKYTVSEQRKNRHQVNIWCDHTGTASILPGTLTQSQGFLGAYSPVHD